MTSVAGIVSNCENLGRVWFELVIGVGKEGWLVGGQKDELGGMEMFNEYVSGVMKEGKGRFQVRHFLSFSNVVILDWILLCHVRLFSASHNV